MNYRVIAAVSGMIVSTMALPAAQAAKFDRADLTPFKGSYTGTLSLVSSGAVVISTAATITFVPAKSGTSAVLTISAPFTTGGVTYNFGATFHLLKNRTTSVSDVILGFAPGESFPSSGTFARTSAKEISLAESVSEGGTTIFSSGPLRISKKGAKKQEMDADLTISTSADSTTYTMQFRTIGKAPKLKP